MFGRKVVVTFTPEDMFNATALFKNHRDFLQHLFKKEGIEVTQFHNEYNADGTIKKQGIQVGRTDSDLIPTVTVTAVVGVNAKEIHSASAGN
jgi:hypothetical protein